VCVCVCVCVYVCVCVCVQVAVCLSVNLSVDRPVNLPVSVCHHILFPFLTHAPPTPELDGQPAWSARLSSNFAGAFSSVRVSSSLWPGAHAYALGKKFQNVYIGWGQKFSKLPYRCGDYCVCDCVSLPCFSSLQSLLSRIALSHSNLLTHSLNSLPLQPAAARQASGRVCQRTGDQ
jgi:hypothetical protein